MHRELVVVASLVGALALGDPSSPTGAGGTLEAPKILSPSEGTLQVGPRFEVIGTVGSSATVEVFDPAGALLCETKAFADGSWRCEVEQARGPRQLTARARYLSLRSPSAQVSFTVLTDDVADGGGCSAGGAMIALVALAAWRRRARRLT
ncbi:MAG: hypothetical protein ACOZQL_16635 [Myxococcota bacterium]